MRRKILFALLAVTLCLDAAKTEATPTVTLAGNAVASNQQTFTCTPGVQALVVSGGSINLLCEAWGAGANGVAGTTSASGRGGGGGAYDSNNPLYGGSMLALGSGTYLVNVGTGGGVYGIWTAANNITPHSADSWVSFLATGGTSTSTFALYANGGWSNGAAGGISGNGGVYGIPSNIQNGGVSGSGGSSDYGGGGGGGAGGQSSLAQGGTWPTDGGNGGANATSTSSSIAMGGQGDALGGGAGGNGGSYTSSSVGTAGQPGVCPGGGGGGGAKGTGTHTNAGAGANGAVSLFWMPVVLSGGGGSTLVFSGTPSGTISSGTLNVNISSGTTGYTSGGTRNVPSAAAVLSGTLTGFAGSSGSVGTATAASGNATGSQVLSGYTFSSIANPTGGTGQWVPPPTSSVLAPSSGGSTYGSPVASLTGTLTLPTQPQVQQGINYGSPNNTQLGTLGSTWTATSGSQGLAGFTFGGSGAVTLTGSATAASGNATASQVIYPATFSSLSGSGTGTYVVPGQGSIIQTGSDQFGPTGGKFDGLYWPIQQQGDVRQGVQFDVSGGSSGKYIRPPGGN